MIDFRTLKPGRLRDFMTDEQIAKSQTPIPVDTIAGRMSLARPHVVQNAMVSGKLPPATLKRGKPCIPLLDVVEWVSPMPEKSFANRVNFRSISGETWRFPNGFSGKPFPRRWAQALSGNGIYLLVAASEADVKIGRAVHIADRIKDIQAMNAESLRLWAILLCSEDAETPEAERFVHALFKDYRQRGEWFTASGVINRYVHQQLLFGNAVIVNRSVPYLLDKYGDYLRAKSIKRHSARFLLSQQHDNTPSGRRVLV